jgi:hypothetical protein
MPLSHLDARDRATIERVREELRGVFAGELQAVALTGEAAGAGYRPGRSPLELAVMLDHVTPEALRRVQPRLRAWGRRRVAPPLLVDPPWLAEARDVFPLELLELTEHHLQIHGASDPFARIEIGLEHLRIEVERQLRGKLLHLWEAYLEHGHSKRRLRELLLETPVAFEWILRGALRAAEALAQPAPRREQGEALLAEVERRTGIALPTFRLLERARRVGEHLPSDGLDAIFDAYLAEVRALVARANAR